MRVKVLLATNSLAIRPLLEILLRLYGAEVVHASVGAALAEAAHREQPDVILLDLAMLPETAAASIRRLCVSLGEQRPPVVMVTGWAHDIPLFRSAGCDQVVLKPFDRTALFAALNEVLRLDLPPASHLTHHNGLLPDTSYR